MPPSKNRNKDYTAYTDTMGYEPRYSKIDCLSVDSFRINMFEEIIKECKQKKIQLFFFVSPAYKKDFYSASKPIERLCKKEGVPFYNNNFVFGISNNRNYFHDSVHLNKAGSEAYTNLVVKEIKKQQNDI